MKLNCLLFALSTPLLFSCTKETIKLKGKNTEEAPISARPNCYGNFWQTDATIYGHAGNFSINTPMALVYNNKLYVFDSATDLVRIYNGSTWQNLPSAIPFGINSKDPNFGFTIGNKAYVGDLDINTLTHPFWEYDFVTNTWEQKANFPGSRRTECSAATFSIGTKGYVAGGLSEQNSNAVTLQETWEYDPSNDGWAQKADMPLANRTAYASGFSAINKGYVLGGSYITENSTLHLKTLSEYDPVADSWSTKSNFPGQARYHASVFVIGSTAFAGCGRTTNTFFNDFYKYNPYADAWNQVADVPVRNASIFGFAINSKGYVEFADPSANPNFLLKYTPYKCSYPVSQ